MTKTNVLEDEQDIQENALIPLDHFKQKSNWDCGISCVLMILSHSKRKHFLDNFQFICNEENFNKSTWTIDLSYLLKRYDVKHVYYTITIGIKNSYTSTNYYRNIITKSEIQRINDKFQQAKENGLIVRNETLRLKAILKHLQKGPIIILTDANELSCLNCHLNRLPLDFSKFFNINRSYQGHYIVLCGYNVNQRIVYYKNPAFHDRLCWMSFKSLELARKSYGTDEDAIFVY